MAIQLRITKPLNVSLQSKPLSVTDSFQTPQNGAWDIIYFCNMNNGVQSSQVYRLGKVIDITTEGSVLGNELVLDGGFDTSQFANILGDYWLGDNNWAIGGSKAFMSSSGDLSNISTLSQNTNNPLVPPYQGGEYIKTGYTYQVSFDILAVPDPLLATSNIKVGGYTQPASEIFDETTPLGKKTVVFTATSNGLSIICSAIPGTPTGASFTGSWEIDNVSAKQIYYANDSTAVVSVEPDATAQTPGPGDFIFFGKDNQIGTAGVTGYYATVEMKNDSIDYSELFAVSSEITQSSK